MSEKFSVKFKGKVYNDAHRDSANHIWFNNNEYEYQPPLFQGPGSVIVHTHVEVAPGQFVHKSKKSTARLTIIDKEDK